MRARGHVITLITCMAAALPAWAADHSIAESHIDALEAQVRAQSDRFADIIMRPENRTIIVQQVGSEDAVAVDELLARLPKQKASPQERQWSVQIRAVKHSQRQLQAAMARVLTAEPWMSIARPHLTVAGIDTENNVIALNVTTITTELLRTAQQTFGPMVELRLTKQRPQRYSRSDDFPPWDGAIAVNAPFFFEPWRTQTCTTGFALADVDGLSATLTAAHCFQRGAPVRQWGELVGNVQMYRLDRDFALISNMNFSQDYRPFIWTSEQATRAHHHCAHIRSKLRTPRMGDRLWANGAITGRERQVRVTALDQCIFASGFRTCGLVFADSTTTNQPAGEGDSGGPVYYRTDDGSTISISPLKFRALPAGTIVGGDPSTRTLFFQPITTILNDLDQDSFFGIGAPWQVVAGPPSPVDPNCQLTPRVLL